MPIEQKLIDEINFEYNNLKEQPNYITNASLFTKAVLCGNLEFMKKLKEQECSWDGFTFQYAAQCGNLENMKWLKENNCPLNVGAFSEAALCGNLENMK